MLRSALIHGGRVEGCTDRLHLGAGQGHGGALPGQPQQRGLALGADTDEVPDTDDTDEVSNTDDTDEFPGYR